MAYGFIYITTNKINGIRYIGQHTRFNDNYLGSGTILNKAIEKYGRENFEREIIDYANSQEELDELERMYIKKYNAVEDPMFYNIAEGGNVINYWKGKKMSEEHRKNISKNNGMKGKSKDKNPMYGKNFRGYRNVVMLDSNFKVVKEFNSAADAWRYLEKEFGDKRTPDVKAKMFIRKKQMYDGKYYFCRKFELEQFIKEKSSSSCV